MRGGGPFIKLQLIFLLPLPPASVEICKVSVVTTGTGFQGQRCALDDGVYFCGWLNNFTLSRMTSSCIEYKPEI